MQAPGARGPRRAGRCAFHGHALARVTGRAVSRGGQHPPAPDPGAWPSRTGSGRGGACLPPPPHVSLSRRGFSEVVGVFPKLRPSQTMSPPHHVTAPTPGGARPGMGDREPPAAERLAVGRGCARRHFSGTGFGELALRPGRARPNRPPMRRTRLPGWRSAGPTAPRPRSANARPGRGWGTGAPSRVAGGRVSQPSAGGSSAKPPEISGVCTRRPRVSRPGIYPTIIFTSAVSLGAARSENCLNPPQQQTVSRFLSIDQQTGP